MKNVELEILVRKLQARVDELEGQLERHGVDTSQVEVALSELAEEAPADASVHVPEQLRQEYAKQASEYEESVRPEIEKWEQKVQKETERRVRNWCKGAGISWPLRPAHPKWEVIRNRVEVDPDFAYDGPPRTLDKKRRIEERDKREREFKEAKNADDDLPDHLWRDPCGLIRDKKTNVIWKEGSKPYYEEDEGTSETEPKEDGSD